MNLNTSDFDELASKWSSGNKIYESSILLTDTSPNSIFEISFSDESRTFFDELVKNTSNRQQPICNLSKWKNINTTSKFVEIKQRTLNVKSIETAAFFLKKNITTNITQTAFFETNNSLIMYSVAESRADMKQTDHLVVDRWIIKWNDKNHEKVSISVYAKIIWTTYSTPTSTIIKSKWLRFYQSRFERWRHLIKDYIVKYNQNNHRNNLMKPYIGNWCKLNGYNVIKITLNKIEYSDGSHFNVSINEKTKQIYATYGRSKFNGRLHQTNDYDEIIWNNGSIWIRNGFNKFEGEWKQKSTQQKYIISNNGTIKLPITQRSIKYMLVNDNNYNKISYLLNKWTKSTAILTNINNNQQLNWDNGTVWIKQNNYKQNNNKDTAAVIAKNKKKNNKKPTKQNKVIINKINKINKTEIINDIKDENKSSSELLNDYDEEFDIYQYNDDESNSKISPTISVNNDEHFILINDDEFLIENNVSNKIDEWLLV